MKFLDGGLNFITFFILPWAILYFLGKFIYGG